MATWSQYDKDMRGIKQKPEVIMKRKKNGQMFFSLRRMKFITHILTERFPVFNFLMYLKF